MSTNIIKMDQIIKGFVYIPNFLSDKQHDKILEAFTKTNLFTCIAGEKSRKVLQYGYSYRYDRRQITKIKDIPPYLKHLTSTVQCPNNSFDQLIINEYLPGQGISAHIDHPLLFGDKIMCITVGGGMMIDFTKGDQKISIYVQPKSAYIMSGDSRYKWKHGINKAKNDIVNGSNIPRVTRYSLTYRTIKN